MIKPRAVIAILFLWAAAVAGEEFISGYHVEGKYLLFGESMRGAGGGLKPFSQMTPNEVSTVFHELWHAYFVEHELKVGGPIFRAFKKEVDKLHATFPREKRMEIQEEAVGDFIDAVVGTYVQMKRFLAGKTARRRREIATTTRYFEIYARLFRDSYTGYYTKSVRPPRDLKSGDVATSAPAKIPDLMREESVAGLKVENAAKVMTPFVIDAKRFGLPVKYVQKALEKINGVIFIKMKGKGLEADIVWSPVSLSRQDMALIEKTLFEGILAEDPRRVFGEDRFSTTTLSGGKKLGPGRPLARE